MEWSFPGGWIGGRVRPEQYGNPPPPIQKGPCLGERLLTGPGAHLSLLDENCVSFQTQFFPPTKNTLKLTRGRRAPLFEDPFLSAGVPLYKGPDFINGMPSELGRGIYCSPDRNELNAKFGQTSRRCISRGNTGKRPEGANHLLWVHPSKKGPRDE